MKKHHLLVVASLLVCPLILFLSLSSRFGLRQQFVSIGYDLGLVEQSNFSAAWSAFMHRYLTFPLDHSYGSHAVVLLAAAYACDSGAILELGMGSSSTPLLHRLAVDQRRFLFSADSDIRWVNYFLAQFGSNRSEHHMRHVEVKSEMGVEWSSADIDSAANWSIVFIDHRPGPRRQFDLYMYAGRSPLVILHDTEKSAMYKYAEGLQLYPYQYRFSRLSTFTDVLSRTNGTLVARIRFLLESIPNRFFANVTSKDKR